MARPKIDEMGVTKAGHHENKSILSWGLASLAYDIGNFEQNIAFLFPGEEFHAFTEDDGMNFYGIVLDKSNHIAWIFIRGTGGKTWLGEMKSWLEDLNHWHGGDGVYDGFQDAGNRVFDRVKQYLPYFRSVIVTGHSKGAGVTPYVARLCAQNIVALQNIHFDLFAAPPTGIQMFADSLKPYFENGLMTGDRYVSDDIIYTDALRNKKCAFFNGVDVGTMIRLPKILKHDAGIIDDLMRHSPAVINAQLMQLFAAAKFNHVDDFHLLGEIGKRIIN
jgi:hypothetical protein